MAQHDVSNTKPYTIACVVQHSTKRKRSLAVPRPSPIQLSDLDSVYAQTPTAPDLLGPLARMVEYLRIVMR